MTAMPAAAIKIYKALVRLYPPAFRREFALEMACDFGDATREAWRDGRWLAVVPLWIHLSHDLAWTLAAQWLRDRFFVATVLSAFGMTICGAAVAGVAVTQLFGRPFQPFTLGPKDDEAVLILLATVVILVAAAVIMFTVGFSLLVQRRRERARRV